MRHRFLVRLLPNFYKTSMTALPEPVERTRDEIHAFLRADNNHGVILGETAVWTGDESGADNAYYVQNLPLEGPDADYAGTAEAALQLAIMGF